MKDQQIESQVHHRPSHAAGALDKKVDVEHHFPHETIAGERQKDAIIVGARRHISLHTRYNAGSQNAIEGAKGAQRQAPSPLPRTSRERGASLRSCPAALPPENRPGIGAASAPPASARVAAACRAGTYAPT